MNETAKKVAKLLASPSLSKGLSEQGVIAISPEHYEEMLEEKWPGFLLYSEHNVEQIYQLVVGHPEGLEGVLKEIREGYEEYRKTQPVDDSW